MMTLEKQYRDELKMELQVTQSSALDTNKQSSGEDMEAREESLPDIQQIANDTANMSKVLMSCKKRGLYEAMKKGQERKKAHVDLLKERKKKIDKGMNPLLAASGEAGRPSKNWVAVTLFVH
ncbi:hypothetical protein Q3G72_016686 [Acer saccharum]|nr:hypothetical protein Q3G72_016686 [Acer saccharum]